MWLVGVRAFPFLEVLDVGLIVPLEPHHLGIALEGEDVRRHAVEEPTVVRNDHRAAGEIEKGFFQRAERMIVLTLGTVLSPVLELFWPGDYLVKFALLFICLGSLQTAISRSIGIYYEIRDSEK